MFASEFSSGLEDVESNEYQGIKAGNKDCSAAVKKTKQADGKSRGISLNDGYKSSLFRKNPAVPFAVNKKVICIKEPLFSDKTFKNMGDLHPHMVANLEQTLGITKVTAIQDKTISVIMSGKDALVRSQTGSGKTLAYAVPMIEEFHRIRPKLTRADGLRAVIILPTRELALQTYECLIKLVKPYTWLVPGLLIGGEKRKSEKARLRKGITILTATPGRLLDHAKNTQSVSFTNVRWLIIDEADRLLDLGYEKDITSLVQLLDDQCQCSRQTVLLSATLTPAVERLAGLTLHDPVHIDALEEPMNVSVDNAFVIPEQLDQCYVLVPPKLRLVTLSAILLDKCCLAEENIGKILVFMGTQAMVDFHTELLSTVLSDINFYKLHGNMSQVERTHVFQSFRSSSNGVLFCSDVASRGLDLPQVDWIIQYTAPTTISDYVHRVGRTARVGQKGSAVLILAPHEVNFITKLQDYRFRVKEIMMDKCLNVLTNLNFDQSVRDSEYAASTLQVQFETAVSDQEFLHSLGCRAYQSWVRFYSTYPKDMRDVFNFKELHLGHYAKSFALKDPPKTISAVGRPRDIKSLKSSKHRTGKYTVGRLQQSTSTKKRLVSATASEFESGLRPKKRKICIPT